MPEGSKAKTSGQAENGKEMTAKATAEKFEERLEHEVLRILNGWGG